MPAFFFDSSALVKRFTQEQSTKPPGFARPGARHLSLRTPPVP